MNTADLSCVRERFVRAFPDVFLRYAHKEDRECYMGRAMTVVHEQVRSRMQKFRIFPGCLHENVPILNLILRILHESVKIGKNFG